MENFELPELPALREVPWKNAAAPGWHRYRLMPEFTTEDMKSYAESAIEKYIKELGSVTITTTENGEVVAVTRTDDEYKILKVIWMKE